MSIEEIRKIMNPRSVAIYGASDDISKWGGGLMHLVKRHGWQGDIYPSVARTPSKGFELTQTSDQFQNQWMSPALQSQETRSHRW